METTQIILLVRGEEKRFSISSSRSRPPENNPELIGELEDLPDTLVVRSYEETSLVVDLGGEVATDDALEIFRTHGYEPSPVEQAA